MFMFDDDMRDENLWNNSAFGERFYQNRILEENPLSMVQSERDMSYLLEMYPKEARIIRNLVEKALDMEDYRGSFIYDEYPDKFLFFRMVKKITEQYMSQQTPTGDDTCKNPWVTEVTQVILANEIYRRRGRRKYW